MKYIIIHHTGGTDSNPLADTSNQTFEVVNQYHKEKFNFISSLGHHIGYHYFIEKNGLVRQGRAHTDEGAHTIGQNKSSIGVCMAGNFDLTVPTKEQEEALKLLLSKLIAQYLIPISAIVPHRKFASKTCYGRRLPDNWAQKLLMNTTTLQLLVEQLKQLLNKLLKK